jgi:two-component system OmpR family response regulator
MRVLVVEDDADIAGFVAKGLTEAGYTVDVAADGEEGLNRALGEPPYDALVVDLMLPRMDGV